MPFFQNVKISLGVCFITLGALALAGCKKDEDEKPLSLPPQLSFVVGYDTFPEEPSGKAAFEALSYYDYSQSSMAKISDDTTESLMPSQAVTSGHFVQAGIRVFVWKTITDIGLLLPRVAFLTAFNHKPQLQDDGSWVWSYNIGLTHSARLVGKVVDTDVTWEMYISKNDGSFTDFNWYSGRHDLSASAGSWTLRKSPTENYAFVGIDWTRVAGTDQGTIKYTNILPADSGDAKVPEIGSYIYYGKNSNTPYDAFFHIYGKNTDTGLDNLTEIEWNTVSKDGRIKDPAAYENNDWHYWDSSLADTTAPAP